MRFRLFQQKLKIKNDLIDQTPNATAEEMEEANNKVDSIQEKQMLT